MSSPGHDVLAAKSGRGTRTVTRVITGLRNAGFLREISPGTIEELEDGTFVHRRAEYRLTVPASLTSHRPGDSAPWSWSKVPATKSERIAAAQLLMTSSPWLRAATPRALASALRAWFTAGWTPADITKGLDRRPDGRAWDFTTAPKSVCAWARYRLRHWLDEEGRPQCPPSRRAAAERARIKREQDQARRDRETIERQRQAGILTAPASRSVQASEAMAAARDRARRVRRDLIGSRNVYPSETSTSVGSPLRAREARGTPRRRGWLISQAEIRQPHQTVTESEPSVVPKAGPTVPADPSHHPMSTADGMPLPAGSRGYRATIALLRLRASGRRGGGRLAPSETSSEVPS